MTVAKNLICLLLIFYSDEEDFSKGINSFIQSVVDRRKARKSCEGPLTEDMVGVENRILGCATFEKKYVYVFHENLWLKIIF